MGKRKTILFVILIVKGIFPLKAQLGINADISPRAEIRNGYRALPEAGQTPTLHINQRSRLNLSFRQDRVKMHLSFQDVRVWGQEAQKMSIPSVSLHQGWIELMFTDSFSLKVGRQELIYDNQRFFAVNDWIPMAQKHDVALLKHISKAGELHLGAAFNQPPDAYTRNFTNHYGINNYKFMGFGWFNTTMGNKGSISLLGIAEGNEHSLPNGTLINPDIMFVHSTWSVYTLYKFGNIDFMVNPAIQHGKHRTGQKVSAWYLRSEASLPVSDNFVSTLGFELFSGNDAANPGDNRFRTFDPTHGAGHAHNGFMDFFTNIPVHTRNAGLINPFVKNRIKLSSKITVDADLHLFWGMNPFKANNAVQTNKFLGTEIDLTLNYRFNSFTQIIGGYSHMVATESMGLIKNGSTSQPLYFTYIMLRVRPKLL